MTNTLYPRIKSRKLLDQLFTGHDSRAVTAYPLRVICTRVSREACPDPVQVMFSVSKRYFKRAVKRNRIKRQMREAMRLNMRSIIDPVTQQQTDTSLLIACLWISDKEKTTDAVARRMQKAVTKLLSAPTADTQQTDNTDKQQSAE